MGGQRAPIHLCAISKGPLRRADVQNVVAPYEGIAILVLQLTIHVLLSLLHRDVHITVQTSQYTWLSQEFGQKKISETNNQIQFSVRAMPLHLPVP